MRALFLIITISITTFPVAPEFEAPWKNPRTALLIDAFYGNSIDWDELATERRVVGVIHKATVGTARVDPAYFLRKEEALKRGYLWGSYHWGVAGDPEKQADFYIDTIKPGPNEMMALDLEDARSTTLMNVDEAILFVERIKVRTGRYPVLYANHKTAQLIATSYRDSVLVKTPLWYARFKEKVDDFPAGAWKSYALWQFSSEILPQLPIPGTRPDMDIDVFNGSIGELKAAWPLSRLGP